MDTEKKILFESNRLLFRNLHPHDFEIIFDLNNDFEVIKYTGDSAFSSLSMAREFLKDYKTNTIDKWGYGRFMCILKDTNQCIGWCGLKMHPDRNKVDLGFRFFRKYWNEGYATEASLANINYAKEVLHLKELIANAVSENVASIKVLTKVGFKKIGEHKENKVTWFQYQLTL